MLIDLFERMTPRRGTSDEDVWFDYEHNGVFGTCQVGEHEGKRTLAIYEWNGEDPGKGHAAEALAWLRGRVDFISAHGTGELDEDGVGGVSPPTTGNARSKWGASTRSSWTTAQSVLLE